MNNNNRIDPYPISSFQSNSIRSSSDVNTPLNNQTPLPIRKNSSTTCENINLLDKCASPEDQTIRPTLQAFKEGCATIGKGLKIAAKITFVGVLATSAIFILAKLTALMTGILATAIVGATMLTPIGWVYIALRSKENKQKDLERLVNAMLWPSAQLSTFCGKCVLFASEGNKELANKVKIVSNRVDILFTGIGVIASGLGIAATAAVPGMQPSAVAACVTIGVVLGCGGWLLFSPIEKEYHARE